MRSVHDLVEQAKHLPVNERRQLIEELEGLLDEEKTETPVTAGPQNGAYAHTLQLLGTMHSDQTDVASDKYKHLADIYADNHETSK